MRVHRNTLSILGTFGILLLGGGCGADLSSGEALEAEVGDEINDSFLVAGKGDTAGIEEGSDSALGLLKLANEASLQQLDNSTSSGGVGLDRRAAENIIGYREGDDMLPGTADDQRFETLQELDAIPYIGPRAFNKLLDFALANGYMEQPIRDLPLDGCDGDFTPVEIMGVFNQSWLTLRLKRFVRSCQEIDDTRSCEAWEERPVPSARRAYGGYTDDLFVATVVVKAGSPWVSVKGTRSGTYTAEGNFKQLADGTQLTLPFTYHGFTDVCDDYSYGAGWGSGGCLRSHYEHWYASWMTLSGRVSESCAQLATEVVRGDEVIFGEQPTVKSYTETVDMAVNQ